LRGAEVVAMRIGEITWNRDRTQATIAIHGSKAHKVAHEPERITISDYLVIRTFGLDPTKAVYLLIANKPPPSLPSAVAFLGSSQGTGGERRRP
jgi:hypothetical protein